MKKETTNTIIILLVVIIIALAIVTILSLNGTLSLNKTTNTNKEQTIQSNNPSEETPISDNTTINIDQLDYEGKDISDSEIEHIYINREDSIDIDYDFKISMTLANKVKVTTIDENGNTNSAYLSNVSQVIDIIHFSIPASPNEQLIYILLENGDVYYYKVGDSINKQYTATKENKVSKVKKLFIYENNKPNAGGTWELVAITEDNKCVKLNSQSV